MWVAILVGRSARLAWWLAWLGVSGGVRSISLQLQEQRNITIVGTLYRQLGQRIVAAERPDLLTSDQRSRWDRWRRERFLADGDLPWLTVPRALEELEDLARDAQPAQQAQLGELRHFLNGLGS